MDIKTFIADADTSPHKIAKALSFDPKEVERIRQRMMKVVGRNDTGYIRLSDLQMISKATGVDMCKIIAYLTF